MKTCENCGSKVFRLGCVNCDEENYIEEQRQLTALEYPESDGAHIVADSAEILSSERSTSSRLRDTSSSFSLLGQMVTTR